MLLFSISLLRTVVYDFIYDFTCHNFNVFVIIIAYVTIIFYQSMFFMCNRNGLLLICVV